MREMRREWRVQVDGWSDGPTKRLVSYQIVEWREEENPHVLTGPENPPAYRFVPDESLYEGTCETKLDATAEEMHEAAVQAAEKVEL